MSQIEIPDWVVEAAAEAISRRHLSNTGLPFPIAACREDAKAALSAALEGWLEEIACARPFDIHAVVVGDQPAVPMWNIKNRGTPFDRTLYALRQEKPNE